MCNSFCFTTENEVQLPSCTSVTSPANNEQNVPTSINMIWAESTGATGYKIKIGTTSGGNDVLALKDVGNVLNTIIESLPTNKFLCATIIPYNAGGEPQNRCV